MRQIALTTALFIGSLANCANITGTVTIGRTTSAQLTVGYIGMGQGLNKLSNSCGMTVGTNSSSTGVWCTTYKPRNSELQFKNGTYRYNHVELPVGSYYVYAKLGNSFIVGDLVTIKSPKQKVSLNIDLATKVPGDLNLKFLKDGKWSVRIAPANAQGKAFIKGLDMCQELSIEGKVVNKQASFKVLPAGKYLVQVLKILQSGGTGTSHWESFDIAATYSLEVRSGKTLTYQIK